MKFSFSALIQVPVAAALWLAFAVFGQAQEDDPAANAEAAYHQWIQQSEASFANLDACYRAELEKLKKAKQKAGRYQEVLLVESEIRKHDKAGTRDYSELPELQTLRQVYESAHQELRSEVLRIHIEMIRWSLPKLDALTSGLTKQGELSAAMHAANFRSKLERKLAELEPNQ